MLTCKQQSNYSRIMSMNSTTIYEIFSDEQGSGQIKLSHKSLPF